MDNDNLFYLNETYVLPGNPGRLKWNHLLCW